MANLLENNPKGARAADSVFPQLQLKKLGGCIRNQEDNAGIVFERDQIQEIDEAIEQQEIEASPKSRFGHVNIVTDSDEFNQNKIMQSSPGVGFMRSHSTEQSKIAEEDYAKDEEISNEMKKAEQQLLTLVHLLESSIIVDKGEFDCNSPSFKISHNEICQKNLSGARTLFYHQQLSKLIQQNEILKEEPEKEDEDCVQISMTSGKNVSSKQDFSINISRIEDIHLIQARKLFVSTIPYKPPAEDIQTIKEEDLREDGLDEKLTEIQAARKERQQEQDFIKKIITSNKIKQYEEKFLEIIQHREIIQELGKNDQIEEVEEKNEN